MAYNNRCANVQNEFGEGCYRSGDVFYTYCTPYSNELLTRRCNEYYDNDDYNDRNNGRDRDRDRDKDYDRDGDANAINNICRLIKEANNICNRESNNRSNRCGNRCHNRCCNRNSSAFAGGDFGNCYY